MTQSSMMFALAGPILLVTLGLLPVETRALFSVQRVTLVLIVGDSDRPSRQNSSPRMTIRVRSGIGTIPLLNAPRGLFCELYLQILTLHRSFVYGTLQALDRLPGAGLIGMESQFGSIGFERVRKA